MITDRLQTCRLCHKANWEDCSPMVRVSTRHSVHLRCKMDRLPNKQERQEWLRSLPPFKIKQLLDDLEIYDNALFGFVRSTFEEDLEASIQKAEGVTNGK